MAARKPKKEATGAGIRQGAGFALGVRSQLMLFMGGLQILTLLLVWVLVTYGLQPRYNQAIRNDLDGRLNAVIGMIDASDKPISSRDYFRLQLNEEFWQGLGDAIADGKLNVDNACVDISDSTLRSVQYIENLYPCVLHESTGVLSGGQTYTRDTPTVIRLRHTVFEEGSIATIVESGGTKQLAVGRLSADGNYAVIVSASLAQIDTAADVLSHILPIVALFLLAGNLVAAAIFSGWFTKPVMKLAAGSREIAAGNYNAHVDVHRHDELGLLAQEFNHMADEVNHSAQLEKDILANVSHDLRTPLTLIKGYAETVRDISGEDAERRTEQCNIIVDETDRLSALVNSVMELSKVSSGAEKPNLVDFDMSQLCFEVAGRYDAVCEQNHWTLVLDAEKECPVSADPDMIERVLHNLLGNATHHIGADRTFVLRCTPLAQGGCRVEVQDHGSGISPADLPYIFDRYYRARTDAGKAGTGLGLSITKAILQQHGFPFGVDSHLGEGTTFWFEMCDMRPVQH